MGKQTAGLTRARATPRETAGRIEHIAALMRSRVWVRGRTAGLLATEWGLEESTVRNLSAEAFRLVARESAGAVERIREDLGELLVQDAFRASEDGKFGDEARLADVASRILGARAPEKVDVTVQTFAQLQPPAMLAKVREQIAELQRLERELAGHVEAIPALAMGDSDE